MIFLNIYLFIIDSIGIDVRHMLSLCQEFNIYLFKLREFDIPMEV